MARSRNVNITPPSPPHLLFSSAGRRRGTVAVPCFARTRKPHARHLQTMLPRQLKQQIRIPGPAAFGFAKSSCVVRAEDRNKLFVDELAHARRKLCRSTWPELLR